jgi:hypothetical protein
MSDFIKGALEAAFERRVSREKASRFKKDVNFLLDRLADFEAGSLGDSLNDLTANDWHGHVAPAIARLRATMKKD